MVGSKQPLLFTTSRCGLDQWRGIPLGEVEAVAANFEPALQ